jgi:hypothetical protein
MGVKKNIYIKIQRTVIMHIVLYGCETWLLILREERRLRIFKNRVLRRISGRKRDTVTGEWRKLHIDELNDLYFSPNIFRVIKSKRIRWTGHVARMGDRRGTYGVLVVKSEGKRPLRRSRHGWENNIKIDVQEVGCEGMDWIDLSKDRDRWWSLVNVIMNLRFP